MFLTLNMTQQCHIFQISMKEEVMVESQCMVMCLKVGNMFSILLLSKFKQVESVAFAQYTLCKEVSRVWVSPIT